MSKKTRKQLLNNLADNTSGNITAEHIRDVVNNTYPERTLVYAGVVFSNAYDAVGAFQLDSSGNTSIDSSTKRDENFVETSPGGNFRRYGSFSKDFYVNADYFNESASKDYIQLNEEGQWKMRMDGAGFAVDDNLHYGTGEAANITVEHHKTYITRHQYWATAQTPINTSDNWSALGLRPTSMLLTSNNTTVGSDVLIDLKVIETGSGNNAVKLKINEIRGTFTKGDMLIIRKTSGTPLVLEYKGIFEYEGVNGTYVTISNPKSDFTATNSSATGALPWGLRSELSPFAGMCIGANSAIDEGYRLFDGAGYNNRLTISCLNSNGDKTIYDDTHDNSKWNQNPDSRNMPVHVEIYRYD